MVNRDDYARAREAITALKLNGANREVAEHWLSRWRNDKPPTRGGLDADAIWQHKPALLLCQIIQHKALRCITSGAFMKVALGYDISNTDILALTPAGERNMRLDHWWNIVEGAVCVTYREFTSAEGPSGLAQGVGLPFSDKRIDGSRFFLMHTNWRPVGTDWIVGNVKVNIHARPQLQVISYQDPNTELL